MKARWIRYRGAAADFEALCERLALAQPRTAPPILAWAHDEAFLFCLIAPLKFAPGRAQRRLAWALAPAVATFRQFGMPAYLDRGEIWLHGRRASEASARVVGECAVVVSGFPRNFPASCAAALEHAFRLRLEAQHGWQFDHSWPTQREALNGAELLV
jgi:hypothetical protein